MSRSWYEREVIDATQFWEVMDDLARELDRAAESCPTDGSGVAQRLSIEARREVLSRVMQAVEQEPLSEILRRNGALDAVLQAETPVDSEA